MTITDRIETIRRKTQEYGADVPLGLYYPHMRDGHEAEDWQAFRAALETVDSEPNAPGTLRRLIEVYGSLQSILEVYVTERIDARRAEAAEEWRKNSVEVQEWRGGETGFGKPTRIARDAAAAWAARPGYILIEREPGVVVPEDRGHDELSNLSLYRIRTVQIGTEWPEGTVKAKRLVRDEADGRGWICQYLVKPRSKPAERRYQQARRLREIETKLQVSLDYLDAEEIAQLNHEAAELRCALGGN